jgi:hypothetical protein
MDVVMKGRERMWKNECASIDFFKVNYEAKYNVLAWINKSTVFIFIKQNF